MLMWDWNRELEDIVKLTTLSSVNRSAPEELIIALRSLLGEEPAVAGAAHGKFDEDSTSWRVVALTRTRLVEVKAKHDLELWSFYSDPVEVGIDARAWRLQDLQETRIIGTYRLYDPFQKLRGWYADVELHFAGGRVLELAGNKYKDDGVQRAWSEFTKVVIDALTSDATADGATEV